MNFIIELTGTQDDADKIKRLLLSNFVESGNYSTEIKKRKLKELLEQNGL